MIIFLQYRLGHHANRFHIICFWLGDHANHIFLWLMLGDHANNLYVYVCRRRCKPLLYLIILSTWSQGLGEVVVLIPHLLLQNWWEHLLSLRWNFVFWKNNFHFSPSTNTNLHTKDFTMQDLELENIKQLEVGHYADQVGLLLRVWLLY